MTDFNADFDGTDYDPELDRVRLAGQLKGIYDLMKDGSWRTFKEIERVTGYAQPSISAHLRSLRKKRFGEHEVLRRKKSNLEDGMYEYMLYLQAD